MVHYTQEEISNAILHYLLRHPHAQDTLEGIIHWWILEERIYRRTLEISEVLRGLVEKELLIEKRISNSNVLYSLNEKKKSFIETIVRKDGLLQNK